MKLHFSHYSRQALECEKSVLGFCGTKELGQAPLAGQPRGAAGSGAAGAKLPLQRKRVREVPLSHLKCAQRSASPCGRQRALPSSQPLAGARERLQAAPREREPRRLAEQVKVTPLSSPDKSSLAAGKSSSGSSLSWLAAAPPLCPRCATPRWRRLAAACAQPSQSAAGRRAAQLSFSPRAALSCHLTQRASAAARSLQAGTTAAQQELSRGQRRLLAEPAGARSGAAAAAALQQRQGT